MHFSYTKIPAGIEITGFAPGEKIKHLVLPEEIDGIPVAKGDCGPLKVAPGKTATVALKGFKLPAIPAGAEAYVTIEAVTSARKPFGVRALNHSMLRRSAV